MYTVQVNHVVQFHIASRIYTLITAHVISRSSMAFFAGLTISGHIGRANVMRCFDTCLHVFSRELLSPRFSRVPEGQSVVIITTINVLLLRYGIDGFCVCVSCLKCCAGMF